LRARSLHHRSVIIAEQGESMGRKHDKHSSDKSRYAGNAENADRESRSASRRDDNSENPPRTTSRGWFTTPKFGGATSGGGEVEPGPERD
jgi:hypothetical protein